MARTGTPLPVLEARRRRRTLCPCTKRIGAARRLAEAEPGSAIAYCLLCRMLPLKCSKGSQKNWDIDPETGFNACKALKGRLNELQYATEEELDLVRRAGRGTVPVSDALDSLRRYHGARLWESPGSFIDLLFEEDGDLVVVDFKTDSVSAAEASGPLKDDYRLQGGAYTHAIREVTGKDVKEIVFVCLQLRRELRLENLDQVMRDPAVEAEKSLPA